LIVDNNSQDDTAQLASTYNDRLPTRYVREPQQGLSHARNRALAEFRGELLAFIDDDVEVDPKWAQALVGHYEDSPGSGFYGGRVDLRWQSTPPSWFEPGVSDRLALIDGLLCHYDLGGEPRAYSENDPLPFGANFAITPELIDRVGVFNTTLGVSGGSTGRGEDTDYFMRAREAGFAGYYCADALAWHRVDPARLSLRHCFRYGIASGIAHRNLHHVAGGSYAQAAWYLVRGLRQSLLGRGDRFRQCVINSGIMVGLKRGTA